MANTILQLTDVSTHFPIHSGLCASGMSAP